MSARFGLQLGHRFTTYPPSGDEVDRLRQLLDLDTLTLFLNDESGQLGPPQTAGTAVSDGAAFAQAAAHAGAPHVDGDRVALPLLVDGRLLGILILHRAPDIETAVLQTMADELALSLENARLRRQLDDRTAQLRAINRIGQILSLAPQLKIAFDGVRREIMALVDATGMSISLLDETGERLQWIYGFEYGEEIDLSRIPSLPLDVGFSGMVARTRRQLHIHDANAELREQLHHTTVGAQPGAWFGLPLIVSNELIGVLAVENAERTAGFSQPDIELMTAIAGPFAIAIHNQRQFDQLEEALLDQSQNRLQLQTAAEVSAAAGSILDLGGLLHTTVHLIRERFELTYVGVFLVEQGEARLRAGAGEAGRRLVAEGYHLPVGGDSPVGQATAVGQAAIRREDDERWQPVLHLPHSRAELAVPLRARGQTIGALDCHSTILAHFTPALVSALQTMSDQIAIAIENARLLARTEARAQRQRVLNEVSAQLHRSADVDAIIETGLRALSRQLGGAPMAIRLGRAAGDTPGEADSP